MISKQKNYYLPWEIKNTEYESRVAIYKKKIYTLKIGQILSLVRVYLPYFWYGISIK